MQTIRNIFSKTPSSSPTKASTTVPHKTAATSPTKVFEGELVKLSLDHSPSKSIDHASSPWDADDEEFDPRVWEDLRKSPTKTLRSPLLKSARGSQTRTPSPSKVDINATSIPPTKYDDIGEYSDSPWDAHDSEFNSDVYIDLKEAVKTFKSNFGSFKRSTQYECPSFSPTITAHKDVHRLGQPAGFSSLRPVLSYRTVILSPGKSDNDNDHYDRPPSKCEQEGEDFRAEQRRLDTITELNDAKCMACEGSDLHDELVSSVYLDAYTALPLYYPARHMHIVNREMLIEPEDDVNILLHALPRLCDAVATVLFYSELKALDAFLDPNVKVFEWWRRTHAACSQPSVVIRRVGNEVLVGTFRNYGFKYVWCYYVKSVIDFAGKWTETFASYAPATTDVTKDGNEWDSFELIEPSLTGVDSNHPIFALYIGRKLGRWMLRYKIWNYSLYNGDMSEWVADGKATRIRMDWCTDPEYKADSRREEEDDE